MTPERLLVIVTVCVFAALIALAQIVRAVDGQQREEEDR